MRYQEGIPVLCPSVDVMWLTEEIPGGRPDGPRRQIYLPSVFHPGSEETVFFAEDISKQLRRRICDLRVVGKLGRRGDLNAEPHDVAHAVQ
jgi:hypothetical protein